MRGVCFGLLLLAAFVFPLLLGGNRPWAVGMVAGLCWLGLAALGAVALALPHQLPARPWARGLPAAWVPLCLFAGLAAVPAMQLLAGNAPLSNLGLDGSIDRFQTGQYLLKTLLYGGSFALTLAAVRTELHARRLLGALVICGLVQALAAIALQSTHASYWYFFTYFQQGERATGTFANADHLAGYMELCLSAGLGLMVAQFDIRSANTSGTKQLLLASLRFIMSPKMLLRLILVVMVIALVMTHSRMGNGAFFISLLAVSLLVAWRSPKLRRPAWVLIASMVIVDVVVIGQMVGLDRVVTRLQETDLRTEAPASSGTAAPGEEGWRPPPPHREETLEQRLRPARAALALVAQRPMWGFGGGSFEAAFPAVKTADVIRFPFDYAHNDYVQQAAEVGLLGLALWLGIGVLAGWRALRLLSDQQPRMSRGVAVASLLALCCLGLHSVVDFNLQIPANAWTFTVLLALPFTQTVRPTRRAPHSPPVWPLRLGALALLCVAPWVFWQAQRTVLADLASANPRRLLARLETQTRQQSAADYQEALEGLQAALRHTPDAPSLWARLGDLEAAAAAAELQGTGAAAQAQLAQAQAHYEQAIQLRPTAPALWVSLADVQFAQGQTSAGWQSWRQAKALGPYEQGVRAQALDMALKDWPQAPADVQRWLEQQFDEAGPAERADMNAEAQRHGLAFSSDH